jgi:hypothetical protein
MLAYQLLPKRNRGSQLSVTGLDVKSTSCPVIVEKILKKFKTHSIGRCAVDSSKIFTKSE